MRQQVLLEKLSKGRQQISKPYIQLTLWTPQRVHISPPRRSGRERCPTIQQTRRLTTNVLRVNQIERFPYQLRLGSDLRLIVDLGVAIVAEQASGLNAGRQWPA